MRILVVDDDETLRFTVRSTLETRAYKVDEAEDGEQAILKAAECGPYDFVFLDVNMPKMSGLEALAAIKDKSPSTTCLVMTA
jgi:DNA-binding response OmpR family regulator